MNITPFIANIVNATHRVPHFSSAYRSFYTMMIARINSSCENEDASCPST